MKVAELRNVLVQANVAFDSKLTKPALIKKILETPAAVTVASAPDDGAGADDDLVSLASSCLELLISNIWFAARLAAHVK